MSFDASKTIMLEKQYLYVKASKGFQLEGMNTERIWTNSGYYRFLVNNVAQALSNSYVKILYDSTDIDFIAYCSDLFMEEIQNTVVVAIENLQSYVEDFYERNHDDFGAVQGTLDELSAGLSGAMQEIVKQGKLFDFSVAGANSVVYGKNPNYGITTIVDCGQLAVGERVLVVCRSYVDINSPSISSNQSFNGFLSYLKITNFYSSSVYLVVDNQGDVFFVNNFDSPNISFNMPMNYMANVWRIS